MRQEKEELRSKLMKQIARSQRYRDIISMYFYIFSLFDVIFMTLVFITSCVFPYAAIYIYIGSVSHERGSLL